MLGNITRLALAISVAAPFLAAGTIYQPSAYDDVTNVGFSAGNSSGIAFVGTDTSVPSNGVSWVSYWVFDLPTGSAPITSATFDLTPHEFFGLDSSETVNFTAFALSPSLLSTAYAPNSLTGISIYDSILSGAPFGELSVQPSDALQDCQVTPCASQTGNPLIFQFNATGLADINAGLGGVFVIGAYLSPGSSVPTYDAVGVQFNFLNIAGPVSQLDLTSTPEPNSASLFAIAGFAALLFRRIRR